MLQAIKKTLAYASIFNYPLTRSEIHLWLIGRKTSPKEVKRFSLPKQNFSERKKKAKIAIKKWAIAQKASQIISKIPTILSVLVTGNLSMNNSATDDDIDLLIITKKNTLWTTRFFANFLTDLLKIRRHPGDKEYKDKICLNMFLEENHLEIKDKNIYTAHELLQAKPIYDKNHTYSKFIKANNWAELFLPNAYPKIINYTYQNKNLNIFLNLLLIILEFPLSFLQKQYMSSKITHEKILPGQLLFHPNNTQNKILKKYNSLLTNFKSVGKIAVVSKE